MTRLTRSRTIGQGQGQELDNIGGGAPVPSECFQNKKLSTPNTSGYELVLVFEIFVRGHICLIFKIVNKF